jgi:hypothetical protein
VVQRFGQQELEHGVAEELEPLVARGGRVVLEIRGVRDGAAQERVVAKQVADPGLESGKGVAHELALV